MTYTEKCEINVTVINVQKMKCEIEVSVNMKLQYGQKLKLTEVRYLTQLGNFFFERIKAHVKGRHDGSYSG